MLFLILVYKSSLPPNFDVVITAVYSCPYLPLRPRMPLPSFVAEPLLSLLAYWSQSSPTSKLLPVSESADDAFFLILTITEYFFQFFLLVIFSSSYLSVCLSAPLLSLRGLPEYRRRRHEYACQP